MDTLENYRQLIRKILTDYAQVPYAYGEVQIEPVFDRENDRYLLMIVGRENDRRVHGCLVHIDILNGKRGISAETALRLGRYFGNGGRFWLALQARYDLAIAERIAGRKIKLEVQVAA